MNWTVYILECADSTYYTGITNNMPARLATHRSGKGAKYTRGRAPLTLLYTESHPSKSSALKREYHIKSLTRDQKKRLAHRAPPYLILIPPAFQSNCIFTCKMIS